MNKEEVMRLAREAGFVDWSLHGRLESKEEALEHFAKLIAAAEREACVRLCLEEVSSIDGDCCVEAIRARGKDESA